MGILESEAERLAQIIAPDEAELAPIVVAAFVRGGAEREQLLQRRDRGVVGGFTGRVDPMILPYLLQALQAVGVSLIAFLASPTLAAALATIKEILSIYNQSRQDSTSTPQPQPVYVAGVVPESLQEVARVVAAELRRAGLDRDRADLATLRVLQALLERPDDSQVFLELLLATPPAN